MNKIPATALDRACAFSNELYKLVAQFAHTRNRTKFDNRLMALAERHGFGKRVTGPRRGVNRDVFLGRQWIIKFIHITYQLPYNSCDEIVEIGEQAFTDELKRFAQLQKMPSLRMRVPTSKLITAGFPILLQERVKIDADKGRMLEEELICAMKQVEVADAHEYNIGFRKDGSWVMIDLEGNWA